MRCLWVMFVVGCGPRFVNLEPARVRSVEVGLASEATCRAPELRARVTYDDARVLETRSAHNPHGLLRPTDFVWAADVGTVDANARLVLPDLLAWHDRGLAVHVGVWGRADVGDTLTLIPDFACDGAALHDAPAGARGMHVDVALAYVDTQLNGRLVLVRVQEQGGAPAYYLLDRKGPSAARFVVSARGGAGHAGRDGNSGSSGLSGSSGSDGSSGGTCSDGSDGSSGGDGEDGGNGEDGDRGGNGGDGGSITLTYPGAFPELANAIEVVVDGGAPGRGGRGGSGGSGGSGGRGGSGGSAGSTTSFDGSTCSTSSGHDGYSGHDGSSGSSGRDGEPGRAGRAGNVVRQAADDVTAGFTGWTIAER